MKITAIILTYNEEIHIKRCIESVLRLVDEVIIVDSFSTDQTLQIAKNYKINILQNKWINHSVQFNWALEQIISAEWILRVDADEYLDISKDDLNSYLSNIPNTCNGVTFTRRIIFQNYLIKFGGISKIETLRLFRFGSGCSEDRWMDEHIRVRGSVCKSGIHLFDCNLNSVTWWIEKHNKYATLEALEMLNLEFSFLKREKYNDFLDNKGRRQNFKRIIKDKVYASIPLFFRSLLYFIYRYFLMLGFLDGGKGFSFHFLQGFWYRYLVDLKVMEVKEYMKNNNSNAAEAIDKILRVKIC